MSSSSQPVPAAPAQRQTRAGIWLVLGLHIIVLVLTGLYIFVRTLPPTPVPIPRPQHAESAWWGFWPITYVPDLLFTLGVILVVALLLWLWYVEWTDQRPISNRPPTRAATLAPRPRGLPLWMPALGAVLLVAFYLFPIAHTRWGDAYILSRAISWPDPALRLTHTWQAPLDVALHSWVWSLLHEPLGWEDAIPVYYLLSPIAGLGYLIGAIGLARDSRFAPGWLTFGLLASLGVIQQFFGYIENYSFILAGMLIYLWLAIDTLRGERPLWQPALALAVTHALHPSTIVLAPTLLLVGWFVIVRRPLADPDAPPLPAAWTAILALPHTRASLWAIAWPMLLVFGATLALMEAGNHGIAALFTHDQPGGSDGSWFVPLFEATSRWEHYTMFSWLHLRDYLNEKVLSGPIVLWSLLWLGLARSIGWTPALTAPAETSTSAPDSAGLARYTERAIFWFLFTAAALYLLFVWVWNPDYGGQRDWDLFSPVAVPTAVLLCYLLPRTFITPWRLVMAAAPLVLLQSLVTAAWIYQNTLPWEWP